MMKRKEEPNRVLARVGAPRAKATDCIKAVSASERRRILRALHDAGEARSPNEIATAFEISVGNVSYHIKVLKECGAIALTDTQPRRGAVEHFYASTLADHELVSKVLKATEEDDQGSSSSKRKRGK
jgi:DNA-binding transcriptional ArsR family regulator